MTAWTWIALGLVIAFASLWLLDDLRRGAVVLALAGFAAGLAIRVVFQARWRLAVAVIALAVTATVALSQSGIRARVGSHLQVPMFRDGYALVLSGMITAVVGSGTVSARYRADGLLLLDPDSTTVGYSGNLPTPVLLGN